MLRGWWDPFSSLQDRDNAQSSCAGLFIVSHLGFDWPGVWVHVDIASPVHTVSRIFWRIHQTILQTCLILFYFIFFQFGLPYPLAILPHSVKKYQSKYQLKTSLCFLRDVWRQPLYFFMPCHSVAQHLLLSSAYVSSQMPTIVCLVTLSFTSREHR